jgi:two-component system chemotaxis response regulator CheY
MASILIVDDIDVVRLTLRKFLERGGHSVSECQSVEEAESRLKLKLPDVLVTDLWMPGRDGLSLIGTVKSHYRRLPIIAITGGAPHFPQVMSMDAAARTGADRVLMKPVGMQELLSSVREIAS